MNNFIKLYLLSSLSLSFINADTTKFGLGSCLDQDYPQPIWEAIEKEDLDYFVFLGDNVYGDLPSGSLRKMVSAYKKQNCAQIISTPIKMQNKNCKKFGVIQ